jgi:DNA-binding transcriptional ArsR family regulator
MPNYRSHGEIDRVFRALADPGRRVIVERLSRRPALASEIARPLPMSLHAAQFIGWRGFQFGRSELVGTLERYEDSYRLCYVRGPEGIIVELAEQIG